MITMYDTVTVSTVPPDPPAVAGYVGGFWPTYSPLVERFPRAKHLSIAVNASENAECLDCEAGDAVASQVPDWVRRQQSRGVQRPVVYASLSAMPEIISILRNAGIGRTSVRLWTAHYTGRLHLCGPACGFGLNTVADATQWTDRALGRNLDQSVCQDEFFGATPAPVTNPEHYDRFDNTPHRLFGKGYNERPLVERYDKLRKTQTPSKHPHRAELALLRLALRLVAGRLLRVAKDHKVHGKPSWAVNYRGWRYQQLMLRAQGGRAV